MSSDQVVLDEVLADYWSDVWTWRVASGVPDPEARLEADRAVADFPSKHVLAPDKGRHRTTATIDLYPFVAGKYSEATYELVLASTFSPVLRYEMALRFVFLLFPDGWPARAAYVPPGQSTVASISLKVDGPNPHRTVPCPGLAAASDGYATVASWIEVMRKAGRSPEFIKTGIKQFKELVGKGSPPDSRFGR
jgi:hypothetical protein